jgi:hypothetical protein
VGQRIIPEIPDNFHWPNLEIGVVREKIRMQDGYLGSGICFRTDSNLIVDARVALDLLHFLSHIDGASFKNVCVMIHDHVQQPINHPLNPRILDLLNTNKGPQFRIYASIFLLVTPIDPSATQLEEMRRVWRGVFGRPMPLFYAYNRNGDGS